MIILFTIPNSVYVTDFAQNDNTFCLASKPKGRLNGKIFVCCRVAETVLYGKKN